MTALWIALAVIAALISALLLFPIRLVIYYDKDEKKNEASVLIKYMFFKFSLPKKAEKESKKPQKKTEKEPFSFEREKAKIERYITLFEKIKSDAVKILKYAANRAIVFEKVEVDSSFGFSNAMHTGIFTGIYNGFVYSILGVIHHNARLEEMKVNLQPVFGRECLDLHVECILRLKNVHIIIIAINVLKIIKKIKK